MVVSLRVEFLLNTDSVPRIFLCYNLKSASLELKSTGLSIEARPQGTIASRKQQGRMLNEQAHGEARARHRTRSRGGIIRGAHHP